LQGVQWQAVKEVWGGFCAFGEGDEKYCADFGNDIIQSITPGSIYFGGTDPGRFLVTAMCKSQVNADPFFVLTQMGWQTEHISSTCALCMLEKSTRPRMKILKML